MEVKNQQFTGLTAEEVNKRIAEGQTNFVKNKTSKPYWKIFRDNFCTFFNLLCFICFFVLLTVADKTAISNYFFVVLFLVNSFIGTIQEIKAKKTVEKLSLVKAPTAKVLRDGKFFDIAVSDLVLDDIIELSQGMQIPADCVVLSGSVEANESLLTGESISVRKEVDSDLLSGSFIVSGKCLARLTKVGANSYVQQITQKAKVYQKTNSKLLNALNKLIITISILIIPVAIGSGFVNYYASKATGNLNIPDVVISTCSVVIGMIPAGMFFLTTLSLAVGIIKLGQLNTLVQDMYSLEMLARVNVLCLDKTGTITDGNLKVKSIIPLNGDLNQIKQTLFDFEHLVGDENQTATAINGYLNELKPVAQKADFILPFSSQRKYALASFNDKTYCLGAPKFVIPTLSDEIMEQITAQMKIGCRVILFAQSNQITKSEVAPNDLSPLALVVLEDNIRSEAIQTIDWFQNNDVAVRVISGDDPMTVSEIARRAGIIGADKYIDLQNATDDDVVKYAKEYVVFGRVSPDQKALIIKTLKSMNYTVGMTGDGVNDILAMKEADCSVTVASGSGVARSLAHLVLVDNNFNSLPQVVREGRRVVNNIQRSASLYLMKTFFTFAFALISIFTFTQYPFTTGMMLLLEFLIIGIPSVALSIQPNNNRIKGRFIVYVLYHAIPGAIVLVVNALLCKILGGDSALNLSEEIYQTMLTVSLTIGGLAFLITLCYPFDKFRAVLTILIGVIAVTCIVLITSTTVLSNFFGVPPLTTAENPLPLFLILGAMFVFDFLVLSIVKFVAKQLQKRSLTPKSIA